MKRFTLSDLAVGNESIIGRFEDEDNTRVSIEQTIEVETSAAEEAEEAVQVEEAVVESEEAVEQTEEATELYARLDYLIGHASKYGLAQASVHAVNYNNELYELVPSLPALESIPMMGSPKDAHNLVALDSFNKSAKTFWEYTRKSAQTMAQTAENMVDTITNYQMKLDKKATTLATAINETSINEDKLMNEKFSLLSYDEAQHIAKELPNLVNDIKTFSSNAIEILNGVAGPSQVAFQSNALDKLGVEVDKNGHLRTAKLIRILKGTDEEATLNTLGWDQENTAKTEAITLAAVSAQLLPEVIMSFKASLSRLEAAAEGAQDDAKVDQEVANSEADDPGIDTEMKARQRARVTLHALLSAQSAMNLASRSIILLTKQHLNAQRAVYSCRVTG